MNGILSYKLRTKETLYFFGTKLNNRNDFLIKSNCPLKDVEYLLFFDSRGISKSFDESLIKLILDYIGKSIKYLVVARPLEITIWVTLFNFLKLNKVKPKKIITNMGFVDFTPKKFTIIEETIFQYNAFFSPKDAIVNYKEPFILSSGEKVELFMHTYPLSALNILIPELSKENLIIINTPELILNFQFPRPRPTSFREAVNASNSFNLNHFKKFPIISLKNFGLEHSYDGVHYTVEGNKNILKKLLPIL